MKSTIEELERVERAIDALLNYQQADMDGIVV